MVWTWISNPQEARRIFSTERSSARTAQLHQPMVAHVLLVMHVLRLLELVLETR